MFFQNEKVTQNLSFSKPKNLNILKYRQYFDFVIVHILALFQISVALLEGSTFYKAVLISIFVLWGAVLIWGRALIRENTVCPDCINNVSLFSFFNFYCILFSSYRNRFLVEANSRAWYDYLLSLLMHSRA